MRNLTAREQVRQQERDDRVLERDLEPHHRLLERHPGRRRCLAAHRERRLDFHFFFPVTEQHLTVVVFVAFCAPIVFLPLGQFFRVVVHRAVDSHRPLAVGQFVNHSQHHLDFRSQVPEERQVLRVFQFDQSHFAAQEQIQIRRQLRNHRCQNQPEQFRHRHHVDRLDPLGLAALLVLGRHRDRVAAHIRHPREPLAHVKLEIEEVRRGSPHLDLLRLLRVVRRECHLLRRPAVPVHVHHIFVPEIAQAGEQHALAAAIGQFPRRDGRSDRLVRQRQINHHLRAVRRWLDRQRVLAVPGLRHRHDPGVALDQVLQFVLPIGAGQHLARRRLVLANPRRHGGARHRLAIFVGDRSNHRERLGHRQDRQALTRQFLSPPRVGRNAVMNRVRSRFERFPLGQGIGRHPFARALGPLQFPLAPGRSRVVRQLPREIVRVLAGDRLLGQVRGPRPDRERSRQTVIVFR